MLEKEGNNKMSILSDLKKGLKGSKKYQEAKAKRKAKSPLRKAVKSVSEDIKKGLKGSKEYQAGKAKRKAAKAEKKAGKSWTKAVKKQKKGGSGETLSSLVAKRKGLTKGSAEYASVQNKINKAYGVKKRHTTTAESRSKAKPFSPGSKEDAGCKQKESQVKKEGTYAEGGKVEAGGGMFNWPSKDARNGGKG